MPEIVIGLVVAHVGWSLYNTALKVAKKQVEHAEKIELKLVFAMLFGLVLSAIGGVFIGTGLVKI